MSYCEKDGEKDYENTDETKASCTIDSDREFQTYLLNGLFNNGVHAWWLIGTMGTLTVLSIVFTFFSLFVDSRNLFPTLPRIPLELTESVVRDSTACRHLRAQLGVNDRAIENVATLAQSENALEQR